MGDGVTGGEEEPEEKAPSPKAYADIFHEVFPHYLMMGMTSEEYWDGDSWLVKDFREAYRMRKEQENREQDELAWRNGAYLKQALQSVYLMVNGFVPHGAQAEPYPDQPNWVREEKQRREEVKQKRKEQEKQKEEEQMRVAMAYFQAAISQFNKNIEKRKLEEKLNSIPHR